MQRFESARRLGRLNQANESKRERNTFQFSISGAPSIFHRSINNANGGIDIVQGGGYSLDAVHNTTAVIPHPLPDINNEGTNLNTKGHVYSLGGGFRYSPKTKITERFTRTAKDQILYAFSVDDPEVFTKVWKAEMPMRAAKGPIYEYACHEGNYSLPNILAGARAAERDAAAKR